MTPSIRGALTLLALTVTLPSAALAAWPTDPAVNLPICTESGGQYALAMVPDGFGGTIVCWTDARNDTDMVYAQRIDASGNPLWAANGVPVSSRAVITRSPHLVADGAGGAIVSWLDHRSGTVWDVYAERLTPAGVVGWGGNVAVPVATSAYDKRDLAMVSDGAGGAVCVWSETRTPAPMRSYAQRVSGAAQRLWPASGVPLSVTAPGGVLAQAVPDGSGGVVCAWSRFASSTFDVFAQRVDGAGAVRWGADGITACPQPQQKWRPGIAVSGDGGAIVTWSDFRGGPGPPQFYAQRFDSLGAPRWASGGVPLAPTGAYQYADTVLADGAGGLFAVWQDGRHLTQGLFGQHLDANGAPRWNDVGVVVDSTDFGSQQVLASDGAGGLLVTWVSLDTPDFDVLAQSLSPAGSTRWAAHGAPVCIAAGDQGWLAATGDGHGGLTVAWEDGRTEPWLGDIYAQRVGPDGNAGNAGVAPSGMPAALALSAPWPSPAHAGVAVALRFALPSAARVRLAIVDLAGRRVRTLVDAPREAGAHTVTWDGRDEGGRAVPAGLYFVRVEAAGRSGTGRVVIAG